MLTNEQERYRASAQRERPRQINTINRRQARDSGSPSVPATSRYTNSLLSAEEGPHAGPASILTHNEGS